MTQAHSPPLASSPPVVEQYLCSKEVCRLLQIEKRTLYKWVASGKLPPPIRFNARVLRWKEKDIHAHLEKLK